MPPLKRRSCLGRFREDKTLRATLGCNIALVKWWERHTTAHVRPITDYNSFTDRSLSSPMTVVG